MKKIALVTGGSSDLASSICKVFNNHNINVILTYHNNYDKSFRLFEKLKKNGNNPLLIKCDITKEKEVSKLICVIKEKYQKLDYIINNAALSIDNEIYNKSGKEFLEVLNTNVVGPFLIIKYGTKIMNDGVVINISSTDGIDTGNIYNIDYSASKSALNSMTYILSKKYSDVKFVTLAPNFIDTSSTRNMNPIFLKSEMKRINQKKLLSTIEVAKKVYELLIDENVSSGSIVRMDDSNE